MHRIFFDTNDWRGERLGNRRYVLWFQQSLQDIAPIADQLRDGLRVIIYMTGELEMEAVLEYDVEHRSWMAVGDDATILHYY